MKLILSIIFCFFIAAMLVVSCTKTNVAKMLPTSIADCASQWKNEETVDIHNLVLTLELDRNRYQKSAPIVSTLVLKNQGTEPLWINKRMLVGERLATITSEVYFEIMSPWGENAELMVKTDANIPEEDDFVLLKPLETLESKSDGLQYYSYISFWRSEGRRNNISGEYCAWAVYHNSTLPELDGTVWTGKIKSNYVEYELVD